MSRVLVADDEELWSDPLSAVLRGEGFEVYLAETGTRALTEFERARPDIVLLEMMLPDMSGIEVCRSLRHRSNVPIVRKTRWNTTAAVCAAPMLTPLPVPCSKR